MDKKKQEQNLIKYFLSTINKQRCLILHLTSTVPGQARVISPVSIIQYINVQWTGPRVKSRDGHKVIIVDQSLPIQVPRDIDGDVSLVDQTLGTYDLSRVYWLVTESEWHYLGRNYGWGVGGVNWLENLQLTHWLKSKPYESPLIFNSAEYVTTPALFWTWQV